MICSNPECGNTLTDKQQRIYKSSHRNRDPKPPPVCSRECKSFLSRTRPTDDPQNLVCSNPACGKKLTKRQHQLYYSKYRKRRFKPQPVCSMRCHGVVTRVPVKRNRKERWAQDGGHDRAEKK